MWVRIGNYANVITDYVASGSFASLNENVTYYKENNYAILVRTCDFKTNFSKDLVYTDKHGYDFLKNSNLFGGELLLSNIGASIGKVFLVPHLNKKMTLAPNSIMVKTVNEQLNVYLSYIFKSSYGQSILQSISFSSAQAKFNKTDFRKILIPIPPLNEQLRIINQLNLINEKISIINDNSIEISNIINTIKIKILDSYFGEDSSYKSYYENEYKLGDLLQYEQPGPFIVKSTKYSDKYTTPVLTPGKSFILGYTNESDGIYKVEGSKVIIFDDFTTASKLVDFDLKVKSSAMKILHSLNKELFDIDYLFYKLQTINIISDTHKRFWISEYSPLKVRIHTINEQKKIVKAINEAFTILNNMSKSI